MRKKEETSGGAICKAVMFGHIKTSIDIRTLG